MKDDKEEMKQIDTDTFADSYIDACSATDCTGLIPSLPQSESELESYEKLYSFLPKAKKAVGKTTD